jgi:hypothetical protein
MMLQMELCKLRLEELEMKLLNLADQLRGLE